jgi:hypothetical protein
MPTVLYINRESFVFDAAERLAYNMNGKVEPEKKRTGKKSHRKMMTHHSTSSILTRMAKQV